jgi:hypothetical protein
MPLRRGPQDTSKSAGKRLAEEAYDTKNKRLRALPEDELVSWRSRPARSISGGYRVNLRTIGGLCPLKSEGREEQ